MKWWVNREMWTYALLGIGYGFAAAVQPGPLQTYLISQALLKGWQKSLPSALAPLVSDGPIIALCLLVLSQVPIGFQRFLYIAGGSFVLYLAYGTYKSWQHFDPHLSASETSSRGSLLKAALTNTLAPGAYIFWTLVTGPILIRGWRETPINGISLLVGFYVTMIVSLAAMIILFGSARQLGPGINRALLGISAIALFCFGLYQFWLGFTG
jgi:threonine/homoserine/homoserine lactone efflux protein